MLIYVIMELHEINAEIARLQEERCKILNKEKFGNEDIIKSLTWTKNCIGKLVINPLRGAGLPTYSIIVIGKHPTSTHGVTVMGDSSAYEQNVLYGKDYQHDCHTFYTSSKKMLLKFMAEVEFEKFEYDEDDWEILDAARRKSHMKEAPTGKTLSERRNVPESREVQNWNGSY
jgi:hypothetical protein